MANNIDWTKSLTTHPSYGAIPPSGVGYEANSIPNVTISASTISSGLSGGYTIGNGGTGTSPNTVWTTGTTGAGSFRLSPDAAMIENNGRMSLKGDKADLEINGKSLKNWMERVEERLNILAPNPELEQEWDELRRLGERYRKLEKKCKEKAEVWKKLKSMPKPEIK
jgi:hypothetical protein